MAIRKKNLPTTTPKERPIGTANQSQFVGVFGAGSIYEMRGWYKKKAVASSLMISGLDDWPREYMKRVSEPALEALLKVDELLEPPEVIDKSPLKSAVPAIRFPEWMSCSSCGRLGTVWKGHFKEDASGVAVCSANSCDGYGIPSRLVVACEGSGDEAVNHGHISDFPWERWCHFNFRPDGKAERVECDQPQLFLISIKGKTGLDGLKVQCKTCGHGNSLKQALRSSHKHLFDCQGERPWLRLSGAKKHTCSAPVRVLLRGATNVYFPTSSSVISIPPCSNPLHQKMAQDKKLEGFLAMIRNGMAAEMCVAVFKAGSAWAAAYSEGEIADALYRFAEYGKDEAIQTFDDRLSEERQAIVMGHISEYQDGDQFLARAVKNCDLEGLTGWIENLVKVERLREVRAISGFTRVHDDSNFEKTARLSRTNEWLPAINVYGEGIYFELNQDKLQVLEENFSTRLAMVKRRAFENNQETEKSSASFVALHTLAHLLIRQLSLECGYSGSSLRERLYFKKGQYAGVLIYTASASADGTLGGLVQQADSATLTRLIRDALNEASWCSSDPLCIESKGQGSNALNLAACYACCQAPETSCTERNSFLDRGVLIGADSIDGYWGGF